MGSLLQNANRHDRTLDLVLHHLIGGLADGAFHQSTAVLQLDRHPMPSECARSDLLIPTEDARATRHSAVNRGVSHA